MRRNITKHLEEYWKLEKQGKVNLYLGDVLDILDKTPDRVELIYTALQVGVVIGYRIGKRGSRT